MNGWANWETWNASLWIGNDEMLYRIACLNRGCGYDALISVLEDCSGASTPDGVRWDDPSIDRAEMDEMLAEL